MPRSLSHALGPLLGVLLFAVALWTIHHELQAYHYHEVMRHVGEIPLVHIVLALGLTALNYLTLTGYDVLALQHIKHPLPYRQVALTSCISYAFSHTIGLALLSSGSVRYRLYSLRGLSGVEITTIIAFTGVTFWLGFCTVSGVVFLLYPIPLPAVIHVPFVSLRVFGALLLIVPLGYIGWSVRTRVPVQIGHLEFALPSARIAGAQVLVSSIDWILAAAVLYVLLPVHALGSYPQVLSLFLLAQMSGFLSQVPGGLGVFETVIVLSIEPGVSATAVLGALLVYRLVYYLVPFVCAVVLFGGSELLQRQDTVRRVTVAAHGWTSLLAPHALAFTTFLCGAVLVFSGATPAVTSRLHWLADIFPLPVIEVSHFFGSVVGVALLLLARGIQQRLGLAYVLTVTLLSAGIVFSLLKGVDYEEAVILGVMLLALLPCRAQFYRKASLISQRFTAGWIAAIAVVLCGSLWLGWFSYKHVEYSKELWWHFALDGNAPRFLRASVAVFAVTLFVAITKLLRPTPPEPTLPTETELATVSTIVVHALNIEAHLALLGDKALLFNEERTAFIMYGIEGRSWIALGDPVGPEDAAVELAWRFRELCDRHDGWSVFYQVRPPYLPLYLDLGLALLKLGEQGRVRLEHFSLEGKSRKSFRLVCNRLEKQQCAFEIVAQDAVPALLTELHDISAQWLAQKQTREKGFSLGFFAPAYIERGPVAIIRQGMTIMAFANLWLDAESEELSPDLMRYRPEAPDDVMEYLFIQLMLWGKAHRYRWFNLGMSPLAGLEAHALAPLWNRLGAFMFRHGEHFYNFQGVRRYKEKFDPEWEPRYLASPGGLALPRVLTNIATLIAGGLKGVVSK